MSIFSRMKKSRQQAKEHNAKLAEQEKQEKTEKTPYRHVPTHAATDAIASAPPSWREADRQKIQEQNRRRSAMAASGHHMNMPGAPRVGSSLSHVSYPTDKSATPMRMPRAYSYTGVSPYSASYSRDLAHSMPDVGSQFTAYAASTKGKEAIRVSVSGYSTPRTSPTSSQEESESSSGSTSSQDDLEMRLARPPVVRAPPPPLAAAGKAGRRPRAGHRRPSDSSIERIAMANSAKGAARDSRPPTSMRGFASIAPIVNAPAPVVRTYTHPQLELPGSLETSEYSLSSSINASLNTSATTLTSASAPLSTDSSPSPERNKIHSKERKAAKVTRFTELERIESGAEAVAAAPPKTDLEQAVAPIPAAAPVVRQSIVINVFPEEDSIPEPETVKKSKRFSKSGGKLSKKSRWASSKAPAVTV
ncbi:hypothetical protein MKX07_008083 [Trichoderma sp. CBMAI-0711]|uniref:Uncharacterized protein n=1 Tax=Trichoderma parareesei TaxID=858221 RepID=A0A2H2ZCK9_TRIPA|nr:hypothetical protein MKX07_008083 [Trichoderma sp. CBMAI-0711]OTA00156.1 hypothetical protein A9Z42_0047980 [Trichoderma parareesei]